MNTDTTQKNTDQTFKSTKYHNFVQYIQRHCKQDNAFKANMRRADNPQTEYQCWEALARFIDLENPKQRLPYAFIASAMAKDKNINDPSQGLFLGQALVQAFDEGSESAQAQMRLRRLLACNDIEELCRVLRPLLALIRDRVPQSLNYEKLLKDLCNFNFNALQVKTRWAQYFYHQPKYLTTENEVEQASL